MIKRKLKQHEIEPMIRTCYSSDSDFIEKYHELSGSGLNSCVDRTVFDFIKNNIDIFILEDNNNFVGYFGVEFSDNQKWLTGFFIMPNFRKNGKNIWNAIKEHFDDNFYVGMLLKNKKASKFLEKNNCEIHSLVISKDGFGTIYQSRKEVI